MNDKDNTAAKNEQSFRTSGTVTKNLSCQESPRREGQTVWGWKVSEKIMTEKIPILVKWSQRVLLENYKEIYSYKFDNWDEMYQFLKILLPQLTQHETDHLNRPIITKGIESIILKLPPNLQIHMISLVNYIKYFQKNQNQFYTISSRKWKRRKLTQLM